MLCNVTGTLYLPNGQLGKSRTLRFKRVDQKVKAEYLGAVVPDDVYTQSDKQGEVDFDILTGVYMMHVEGGYSVRAIVPDSATASISDIIEAAAIPPEPPVWYQQALNARDEAVDAADRADVASDDAQAAADALEGAIEDISTAQDTADSAKLAAGLTPMDFGAVGDGVADDTAALAAAISASQTAQVNFLDRTYRHTGLSVAAQSVNMVGANARLVYDGPAARYAVKIDVSSGTSEMRGLVFDAAQKAWVALAVSGPVTPQPIRPRLVATDIAGEWAYRADTSIPGGDGIIILGDWDSVDLVRPRASDCYMAAGAEVMLAQGIFGITVAYQGSAYARHIKITDPVVERVWSEDPGYTFDQDGIRIMQGMWDDKATCLITGYRCDNVANRAIKLHSAPNAIVDGVDRVLDATVIPQSGYFQNPDIDAQQTNATISNIRARYRGAWRASVIRTSDTGQYYNGGTNISDVSIMTEDVSGNDMSIVTIGRTLSTGHTDLRATISGLSVIGESVARFVRVTAEGGGRNSVTLSGSVGPVKSCAISTDTTDGSDIDVVGTGVVNTGNIVPFGIGFTGPRRISAAGVHGFTGSGTGINGSPEVGPLDIFPGATGGQRIRLRGSPNAETVEDTIAFFEIYNTALAQRLGLMGYPATNQNMEFVNELPEGDIIFRARGQQRLRVLTTGLQLGANDGPRLLYGTSAPEGSVAAPVGSIYTRRDGGSGSTLYVKEIGNGNTGWVAK